VKGPELTVEMAEIKARGAARAALELAAGHGWIVAAGFPRRVRRRARLSCVTQVALQHADGPTVFLDYSLTGALIAPCTVAIGEACWYIGSDPRELQEVLLNRAPPRRAPDIAHDEQLHAALRQLLRTGHKDAPRLLDGVDRELGQRGRT
jgi:hypothetical protein